MSLTGIYSQLGDVALSTLIRNPLREVHERGKHRADPLPIHPRFVRGGEEIPLTREYGARVDVLRERPEIGKHAVEILRRPGPTSFSHKHLPSPSAAEAGIISEGHHRLRKSLTEALGNGIFTSSGAISSAESAVLDPLLPPSLPPYSPKLIDEGCSRKFSLGMRNA